MDKLDDVGTFWLAGEPDNKVHGALIFDPETGGRLRLDGLLGVNGRPEGYARILGKSQEIGYTLNRCFETHRKSGVYSNGAGVSTWSIGEAYTAVHFEVDEEIAFDTMYVGLEDMTSWIGRSGISGAGLQPVDGTWIAKIEGKKLEAETVSTDFGEVTVLHAIGQRDNSREFTLWQTHGVSIKTENLTPKPELLEIASDIQDLVSMGIDRPSAYTKVQFSHPDIVHPSPSERERLLLGDRSPRRIEIDHFATWRIKPGEYEKPPQSIAFGYEDIGGGEGLKSWLALASQHRRTLARIMGVKQPTGMYSEDRLLNAVAAAEGLHKELTGLRDKRNEMTLKARLIQLAQLAGPAFEKAVMDVEKWAEFLKEERHEHAHNRNQQPSSNIDYYWHMANSAYWLILLCFLTQIPTAGRAIERASNSQGFRWMMVEIGEIIPRL